MDDNRRRAAEICERRDDSLSWCSRSFYGEWEKTHRAYLCLKLPEETLDSTPDNPKYDKTLTAIGMPDTFGFVRRAVARGTAQSPSLAFKSEGGRNDLLSRTLMYQWDRGGTQRWQKLHFAQAVEFGWSVRAWYWADESYNRKRRVDPYQEDSWGEIAATYEVDLRRMDEQQRMEAISALLLEHGRGSRYLPISYRYTAYEGPKSDVLSVADCFPQPGFRSIQDSEYFIVERRRNLSWIRSQQSYWKEKRPDIAQALANLLEAYPTGTQPSYYIEDTGRTGGSNFRQFLERAYDRTNFVDHDIGSIASNTMQWTFFEEHRPGDPPSVSWVAERDHFIGKMSYPYDLEGRIAFTEAVLIDDIVSGVGNSVPRVLNGLQQLHDRLVSRRADLVDALLRPLMGTTDRALWENAEKQMKRGSGLRLLYLRGGSTSMWTNNESPALAATVTALNEENAYMRQWQSGSGESNMSMAANVDPQQNRTATGASITKQLSDMLTQDMVNMFGHSIRQDAEMMYLLNRSEATSDMRIDIGPYVNQPTVPGTGDPVIEDWVTVSPLDFQVDGEVLVEEGSMLAAEDERNVARAVTMIQLLGNRPDVNQPKLLMDILKAMGKGRQAHEYIAPLQPPPQQPPVRANMSISAKFEEVAANDPQLAIEMLKGAGILPPDFQLSQGQQPQLPPGMPSGPQGGPPPQIPPEILQQLLEQNQAQDLFGAGGMNVA